MDEQQIKDLARRLTEASAKIAGGRGVARLIVFNETRAIKADELSMIAKYLEIDIAEPLTAGQGDQLIALQIETNAKLDAITDLLRRHMSVRG
jgi:hypothetical protein